MQDNELIAAQSSVEDFLYTVLNGTYCEITGYLGDETTVAIPAEIDGYIVQSIADETFKDNTAITEVIFPETIESMGTHVFSGCTSLKDVYMESELTHIGDYAFNGCIASESFVVPEGITSIGGYAFNGCTGLKEILLPESLTDIGYEAFSGCSGLTSITIPSQITAISGNAFYGCSGLKEVNLPEGLTTINAYAFENCTSLTSIDIPDSVTTIAARAFYNGTKLSEVGYPAGWTTLLSYYSGSASDGASSNLSPFEGCTSLKKIEIPEGVTSIPKHAFRYQTSLEEVVLPESLSSIGVYAFDGCTGLKTINLVESITTIPSYCFNNCTGLNYITIPDAVQSVNEYAFYNCIGLRSINMGSGLKTIGRYAFYGCDGLVRLFLSDNIETISEYAFTDCINLKSIILPNNLKTIGKAAFKNCVKVSDLTVPNSVTSIADDSFNGLSKLVFYCELNSYAATYAIDHNIPIIDIEENNNIDSPYIDRQTSYYRVNGDGVSATGYLAMVAKYSFKDSVNATDIKLKFNIPSAVELDESTLTVDGVLCTNYTFENGTLTVPVSNTSGTVRFLLEPLNYDCVTAYCKISFNDGASYQTEILGTIYAEIPILSISCQDETSQSSVKVSGVTIPNSNVTLYVNGEKATTIQANKVGDYSTTIQLESLSNGKKYTIRAEVVDATGTVVTAETVVVYRNSIPKLTKFIMEYGGKTYNLHELVGTKPNVTWASSYQFKFTVKFDNPSSVSSVYIVSTRNNVKKYMEAKWNDEVQAFVAQGYFDNNSSYVPGIISIEYARGNEEILFKEEYDFSSDESINSIPEVWKDAEVIIHEETEDLADITIQSPDGDTSVRIITEREYAPENLTPETAELQGFMKVEDIDGNIAYVRLIVPEEMTLYSRTIEDPGEYSFKTEVYIPWAEKQIIKQSFVDMCYAGTKISSTTWGVYSFFTNLEKGIDNYSEYQRMKSDIANSNLSDEEKEQANKKLQYAIAMNAVATGGKIAGAVLSVAAKFVPGGHLISGVIKIVTAATSMGFSYVQSYTMWQTKKILANNFTWAIDPSGFVYEIDTEESIQGATVTAYWVPFDENDTEYWNNKPRENEYGQVWDPTGFSQDNPITTDMSGWYAWDVPEGWWRVKAEHPDYETAWSEWVEVPPPQTEVHIGMKKCADEQGNIYTVEVSSAEGGVVTGAGTYASGEIVKVTAEAEEGYRFIGWYAGESKVSEEAEYEFEATENISLEARFVKLYTVEVSNTEGGAVTGAGTYANGEIVKVTAEAEEGYRFTGWYAGESKVSEEAEYEFKVTENISLEARFVKLYTVEVSNTEGGVVTGAGTYASGESVKVTAKAEEGYRFIGWYAGESKVSEEAEYEFKVTANEVLKAYFVKEVICRISGDTRYETGYKVADTLKEKLGVDTFDAVVVATGKNFADALSGSYLTVVKNAPILLTNGKSDNIASLHNYIRENVTPGGTVYILGGEAAVPDTVETIDDYDVVRLSGNSRYDTNLEILKAAGITGDELIIATGKSFADSLSASAAKLPILLVKPGDSLNDAQKAILDDMNKIYIIGGEGAVSKTYEAELKAYGTVERVFGNSRYETSVAVANTFFKDVNEVVVASGKNFPDGLCGGPLAATMNAPLILIADGKTDSAAGYVKEGEVNSGFILGGVGAIGDDSVMDVFDLKNTDEILSK